MHTLTHIDTHTHTYICTNSIDILYTYVPNTFVSFSGPIPRFKLQEWEWDQGYIPDPSSTLPGSTLPLPSTQLPP